MYRKSRWLYALSVAVMMVVVFSTFSVRAQQLDEYAKVGSIVPGDQSACGVYCIYIAARLMDIRPDINQLARVAKLDLSGSTMLGLKRAAESIGLVATGYAYPKEQWNAIKPLSVVHVEKNHYVLLLKTSSDAVEIIDPPSSRKTLSSEEFMKIWDGNVLEFEKKAIAVEQPDARFQEPIEIDIIIPSHEKEKIKSEFDFGSLYAERMYPFTIKLSNKSDVDLKFSHCKASCGCTTVDPDQKEIPKGEVGHFNGRFSTASLAGPTSSDVIMIFGDEPNHHIVFLTLRANILTEGRLRTVPRRINFITTKGTPFNTVALTVTRDSGVPLGLVSIDTTSVWLRIEEAEKTKDNASSCTWNVNCDGDIPVGEHQTTITVTTDHQNFPTVEIPVFIVVKSDITFFPKRLVSVITDNTTLEETKISLESSLKTEFRITNVRTVPADIGEVRYDTNIRASQQDIFIELSRPSKESAKILTGQIVVEFDHPTCSQLAIPVLIKNEMK